MWCNFWSKCSLFLISTKDIIHLAIFFEKIHWMKISQQNNLPYLFGRYCTFVPPPPTVIDDSSWKNAAESFTVALTLTLGGYESAIAPFKSGQAWGRSVVCAMQNSFECTSFYLLFIWNHCLTQIEICPHTCITSSLVSWFLIKGTLDSMAWIMLYERRADDMSKHRFELLPFSNLFLKYFYS